MNKKTYEKEMLSCYPDCYHIQVPDIRADRPTKCFPELVQLQLLLKEKIKNCSQTNFGDKIVH